MVINIVIIGFTVLVSLYTWSNRELFDKLKLNPYMVVHRKEYFRLIGHGFLHADYTHLIFNMITLYFFGDIVEQVFASIFPLGNVLFVLFYLIAIIVSSIPSIIKHKNNQYYNSIGASGAVSAVLFASIIFAPHNKLLILPIPFPIPAYIFGGLYLLVSYYLSRKNMDNIGHDAHIAGAIFGIIFPIILKPELVSYFIYNVF